MMEKNWKRTHTCGALRQADEGRCVTLNGWVRRCRDHGGLLFVDLADRYGVTQTVFNPEVAAAVHRTAERLRPEYVISVEGTVRKRPEGTVNPKLETGEVEVLVYGIEILSEALPPPFPLDDSAEEETSEEVRLRYRYLDMRRRPLREAITFRSRVVQAARAYLHGRGFVEVETPILTKSTPEGARDYLVPSRVHPGAFYALPQSPQLLKQILMIGGMDRYYQIARCFRDEDLRSDRQPEFTQIDMEMSFVDEGDVYEITEGLMAAMFRAGPGIELPLPFPRIPYAEAVARYGSDKPDLRYGLELADITDLSGESAFTVLRGALENEGAVSKALAVPGLSGLSRKETDDLVRRAQGLGARGLLWIKWTPDGMKSPLAKHDPESLLRALAERSGARQGDLVLIVAGARSVVNAVLSALRSHFAEALGLIPEEGFRFCWVVGFPLFSWNEEEGRFDSEHHPFTSPHAEDLPILENNPLGVRSLSYDLVLNGSEVGSGSVRIHRWDVQKRIFDLLRLSEEEIRNRFGFFLEALKYGTPPHAGIAPGLDRIIAIMLGRKSIRDVIAFPKTQRAACPMSGAPSAVSERQLKELRIRLDE